MIRRAALDEISAESRLDSKSPAFATNLRALTCKWHCQAVIDGALAVEITQDASHKRISLGFIYAIANLYARQ
jgi:hypothetical protein